MLQSMGPQRVGHDWVTELNWTLIEFWSAAAAKSLQSCPTLCDPIDGNPPGSPVPGILQVKTVEWVAISFSNAWKWKVKVKSLSRARLLATPWTADYQAPPSMGFSRQEYWSGGPSPSLLSLSPNWGKKRVEEGAISVSSTDAKMKMPTFQDKLWPGRDRAIYLAFMDFFLLISLLFTK